MWLDSICCCHIWIYENSILIFHSLPWQILHCLPPGSGLSWGCLTPCPSLQWGLSLQHLGRDSPVPASPQMGKLRLWKELYGTSLGSHSIGVLGQVARAWLWCPCGALPHSILSPGSAGSGRRTHWARSATLVRVPGASDPSCLRSGHGHWATLDLTRASVPCGEWWGPWPGLRPNCDSPVGATSALCSFPGPDPVPPGLPSPPLPIQTNLPLPASGAEQNSAPHPSPMPPAGCCLLSHVSPAPPSHRLRDGAVENSKIFYYWSEGAHSQFWEKEHWTALPQASWGCLPACPPALQWAP